MRRFTSTSDIRVGHEIGIGNPAETTSGLPSFSYGNQGVNRFSQSNPWTPGYGYNINATSLLGCKSSTNRFFPEVPNNTDATGTWKIINSANFANDTLLYCYFYCTTGSGNNQTESEAAGAIRVEDGSNEWSSVYDTSTLGTDTFGVGGYATTNLTPYTVYTAGVTDVLNWNRLGAPSNISLGIACDYGKTFYGFYEDRFHSYNVTTSSSSGTFTYSLNYTRYRDYKYLHGYFN
jgi:hypothetical protein